MERCWIKLRLILAATDFLARGKICTVEALILRVPWTPTSSPSADGPLKALFLLVLSTRLMASMASKQYVPDYTRGVEFWILNPLTFLQLTKPSRPAWMASGALLIKTSAAGTVTRFGIPIWWITVSTTPSQCASSTTAECWAWALIGARTLASNGPLFNSKRGSLVRPVGHIRYRHLLTRWMFAVWLDDIKIGGKSLGISASDLNTNNVREHANA